MKIKFLPQNIEVDLNPNKSVLNTALDNGVHIHSICKGVPSCAECRIKIVEGENYVNKPSKAELNLIGTSYYIDGRRLSCQVKCFGPVTVDTTEQVNRQDNPAKKLRGFKSEKQYESHAILDTMILTEPVPAAPAEKPEASDADEGHNQQPQRQQQKGGGRPQHQQGRGSQNHQQQDREQGREQNRGNQDRHQQQTRGSNQDRQHSRNDQRARNEDRGGNSGGQRQQGQQQKNRGGGGHGGHGQGGGGDSKRSQSEPRGDQRRDQQGGDQNRGGENRNQGQRSQQDPKKKQ